MLDRYKKTGGFVQLVKLVEACNPAKQEKLLITIRAEDGEWASAVERKMLKFDRIMSWNDAALAEIVGTLQDLTVAILLHAVPAAVGVRVRASTSHSRSRRIEDLYSINRPTANELQAITLKVVEAVRQMAIDGQLRLEKIDPDLAIEDGAEDRLKQAHGRDSAGAHSVRVVQEKDERHAEREAGAVLNFPPPERPASPNGGAVAATDTELSVLRKKTADLGKENALLRYELQAAKLKIEQIRKII